MELRDLESYGEPGAVVYVADCVELMRLMPASCLDAVFADPPYRLSTGRGVTVKSGRLAPVDKGSWDRSLGTSGPKSVARLHRLPHDPSRTAAHNGRTLPWCGGAHTYPIHVLHVFGAPPSFLSLGVRGSG
jgi:hypothetical protein